MNQLWVCVEGHREGEGAAGEEGIESLLRNEYTVDNI